MGCMLTASKTPVPWNKSRREDCANPRTFIPKLRRTPRLVKNREKSEGILRTSLPNVRPSGRRAKKDSQFLRLRAVTVLCDSINLSQPHTQGQCLGEMQQESSELRNLSQSFNFSKKNYGNPCDLSGCKLLTGL